MVISSGDYVSSQLADTRDLIDWLSEWVSEWAGFNVSTDTVYVIWETVLQVKRPNQQYQSTEGKKCCKSKENPEKSTQHKIQQHTIKRHIQKNTASPLVYTNTMGVSRGRLPQRTGLPIVNGGGATAVGLPPQYPGRRNHWILWTTAAESTTPGWLWLTGGFAAGINFSWKNTAAGCDLASTWANASSSLDGKGDLQPEDLTDSSRIPRLAYLKIFITKIHIKFWFLAPVASKAACNHLKLLQQLQLFPDRDISEATSHKLAGQLWYLLEELILFTVFDSDVDVTTKWDILKASMEKEGGQSLKRADTKTLADLVSKWRRAMFMTLGMPDGFLVVDPELWTTRDDYKAAEAIANTLVSHQWPRWTRCRLDSGCSTVRMLQEWNTVTVCAASHRKNRAEFPDAKKSTLLQKTNWHSIASS